MHFIKDSVSPGHSTRRPDIPRRDSNNSQWALRDRAGTRIGVYQMFPPEQRRRGRQLRPVLSRYVDCRSFDNDPDLGHIARVEVSKLIRRSISCDPPRGAAPACMTATASGRRRDGDRWRQVAGLGYCERSVVRLGIGSQDREDALVRDPRLNLSRSKDRARLAIRPMPIVHRIR